VIRLRVDLQVLWPIVVLVAVLVVNDFTRMQQPADHLFGHYAMMLVTTMPFHVAA